MNMMKAMDCTLKLTIAFRVIAIETVIELHVNFNLIILISNKNIFFHIIFIYQTSFIII